MTFHCLGKCSDFALRETLAGSARYRLLAATIGLAIAALAVPWSLPVPSYEVRVFDEYNDYPDPHLLSDWTYPQPRVKNSVTATVYLGPDPLPNQTVVFTSSDTVSLRAVEGDWPVTLSTDAKGQARIEVRAGESAEAGEVVVTCSYTVGVNTFHDSTTVQLYHESQVGADTPQWEGVDPLSNPCAIKYQYSLTFVDLWALVGWTMSGNVAFSETTPAQISFSEYYDVYDGNNALTYPTSPRIVKFNGWRLNGDPTHETYPSDFVRSSWRHHLRSTVSHEIGHALALDHNDSTMYSIMFHFLERYFVWEVIGAVENELDTFYELYPNSCALR